MQLVLILLAGFGAGFINALAGGGSFLTFPALIAAGLPAIDANASSRVNRKGSANRAAQAATPVRLP